MAKIRKACNPRSELQRLRSRLAEAEDTLEAIRAGAVDAIAVDGPAGRQIFTLQSAEQPYRILAEQMNEGAASIGSDGTILFCNNRLATMVGRPPEKLVGSPAIELAAASERKAFQQLLLRARKGEARGEALFQGPGGAMVPVLASVKMIAGGQTPGLCLVATDVHELKRAEHDLRLAQEDATRLASIVTWSNDAIIGKTLDGVVTSWNPGAENIYGYSAKDMIGQSMLITILPDRIAEFQDIMQRVGQGENVHHFECQRLRKDGKVIYVSLSVNPLKDSAGKIVGASTIARDITERKRAELALRQSEARLQLQFERMPIGCIVWSPEFRVMSWNPAAERIFGFKEEEAKGRHPYEFIVPKNLQPKIDDVFRRLRRGDSTAHSTNENVTADGRTITCQWTNTPLKGANGDTTGVLSMVEDVSDRKRAEASIVRERQRFESVLDRLPVMVCLLTPSYDVAFANHAFRKQFGECQGRKCFEYCFGRSTPCEFCETFQVLKTEAPHDWEVTTPNGRRIHAFDFPFTDGDGSPLILEMDVDITEQRVAEERLREASRYTRSLIEASLDPLVTIDKDGRITDVNEATEEATGVARKLLIGSDFSSYFTVPEKADQGYRSVFADGFVRDYPLAIRHASGKVMDVLYNASLFKNEKGEVEGVFAAARDITERKRAEEALQESEERFRTLANLVPQLVWMCQPDGLNIYFNQRWFDYTGLTPEQSYGRNWSTPFHTDDQQAAQDAWNHAVATGDLYRIESRLRSADGSYRWFLMRGVPLRDKAGAIVKWFGTCTDIDDLKRAEAEIRTLNRDLEKRVEERTSELRESESHIRRKLDTILSPESDLADLAVTDILDIASIQTLAEDFYKLTNIPLFMVDLKGKILVGAGWQEICTKFHRVHPATCKNCLESDLVLSTGVKPGELKLYKCKNNMWDAVTPLMLGEKHIANIYTGQFFFADEPVDLELFRSQAREYGFDEQQYMAALAQVPRLAREQVETSRAFFTRFAQLLSQLSYSGIKLARSMEQTRDANNQLTTSNKELEAFTYSVSHDLRAPLRHISGFSKILTEEFGPQLPSDAQQHLQRIQEGTRRMGMLVDDLLNLARVGRRDITLQVTGLKAVVEEVIASLVPDIGERQIEWKLAELPYVECDTALMRQVFQNLLANAVKFTRPRAKAVIEIGQTEKDGVPVVYVRDNGVGFSMKYADKLFGVFQRLHRTEDFEGTGVGLATVQRIIQKHGGRIWAEAELDKGATFYFTLGKAETGDRQTKEAVAGVRT